MSKGLEAFYDLIKNKTITDEMLIIEKELKALEIIKNKDIFFVEKIDKEYYLVVKNIDFQNYNIKLSQEEYYLLKEELL